MYDSLHKANLQIKATQASKKLLIWSQPSQKARQLYCICRKGYYEHNYYNLYSTQKDRYMAKFGKWISIYKILQTLLNKNLPCLSPRNLCCKATVSLCNARIKGRTAEAGITPGMFSDSLVLANRSSGSIRLLMGKSLSLSYPQKSTFVLR